MNAQKVMHSINTAAANEKTGEKTARDHKTKEKVHFTWQKRVENGFIYKKIDFKTATQHHTFEERVRAFTLADLTRLAENAGLQHLNTFGNYNLAPYDAEHSDRMIVVFQK